MITLGTERIHSPDSDKPSASVLAQFEQIHRSDVAAKVASEATAKLKLGEIAASESKGESS